MNVIFRKGTLRVEKMTSPQIMFVLQSGEGAKRMIAAEFLTATEARDLAHRLEKVAGEFDEAWREQD